MIEAKTEDYEQLIEQYPIIRESNDYVILKVPERIYYDIINRYDKSNRVDANFELSRQKMKSVIVKKTV